MIDRITEQNKPLSLPSFNEQVEVAGFDIEYTQIADKLYASAFELINQEPKLTFSPSPTNIIQSSGQLIESPIDCFVFVLLVLENLNRQGAIINFPQIKSGLIVYLKKMVETGILVKTDILNFDDLPIAGIFFVLKTDSGWTTKYKRHLGFYFKTNREIHLLHSTLKANGPTKTILTQQEFQKYIDKSFTFYITMK